MRSEKEIKEKDLNRLCIDLLCKPHYSVAELELLSNKMGAWDLPARKHFIDFLKDTKKVQEILK